MVKNTLLLSSGGIKGYVYLGIWKYLQEQNISIRIFSGVSIGAVFSMLFILGFSFEEIYDVLMNINLLNMFDFDFTNFFSTYGMVNIEKLNNFIIKKINEKGYHENVTFQEIYEKTNCELHTYSVCVNTNKLERFDKDNTPDYPIWSAVKMSMSIPLIFPPILYNNKYYVDGAVQDGFPMNNYDKSTTIPCIVCEKPSEQIANIFDFINNTYKSSRNQTFSSDDVCYIYPPISMLKINIKNEEIDNLITIGYNSIQTWLNKNKLD